MAQNNDGRIYFRLGTKYIIRRGICKSLIDQSRLAGDRGHRTAYTVNHEPKCKNYRRRK